MKKIVPLITCEIPLVNISASWCLVSTYRIRILESRSILSNNQSKATLWVLNTCLSVWDSGLLLSSQSRLHCPPRWTASHQIEKTHYSNQNCRAGLEPWLGFGCACLMWCHATSFIILDLWCCWIFELVSGRMQELEFHPCVNLHREKLFQLLWSCVTLMSASCTSKLLEQTCDSRKCIELIRLLIFSVRDLLQNQNFEIIQACIVVLYFAHDNIVCIHMRRMSETKRAKRLSQALVHLVIARTSLFTDHKISGPLIWAKYKHFKTISEQTADNSPTDFIFFLFKWMVIHAWCCDFVLLSSCFTRRFKISFHAFLCVTFFAWPSMSKDQEDRISASGLPEAFVSSFSLAPAEILDSNVSLYFVSVIAYCTFTSQRNVVLERCWFFWKWLSRPALSLTVLVRLRGTLNCPHCSVSDVIDTQCCIEMNSATMLLSREALSHATNCARPRETKNQIHELCEKTKSWPV